MVEWIVVALLRQRAQRRRSVVAVAMILQRTRMGCFFFILKTSTVFGGLLMSIFGGLFTFERDQPWELNGAEN